MLMKNYRGEEDNYFRFSFRFYGFLRDIFFKYSEINQGIKHYLIYEFIL